MRFVAVVLMMFAGDVELPKLSSPPTGAELQILKARRLDLAQKAYADNLARLKAGTGTVEAAFTWSQRFADAEKDAGDPRQAASRAIDRAKLIEGLARERVATGTLPAGAANEALWWRAEVELQYASQPR